MTRRRPAGPRARTRRLLAVLAISFIATFAIRVDALELWDAGYPSVPDGADSVVVERVVSVRNGRLVTDVRPAVRRIERDADGRQVIESRTDPRGDPAWLIEYRYADGVLASIDAVRDVERWSLGIEYHDGRAVRETLAGSDGEPARTVVHAYSDDAHEVIEYRADGSVAWRRIDANGSEEASGDERLERRTTFYYPDGSRVKAIRTIVGSDGLPLLEEHHDEIGTAYRSIEYEYRDGFLVTRKVTDHTGSEIRRSSWIYDEAGDVRVEGSRLPREGLAERTVYRRERDSRGNWTTEERVTTAQRDGEAPFVIDSVVTTRQISYASAGREVVVGSRR